MSRIGERVRDEIMRLAETPNGRRLELKRVFREFDSDGNGRLSQSEFSAACEACGCGEDAAKLFAQMPKTAV